MSLFSLYAQRFQRYRPIFEITKIGHETWPLAKVPEVAHIIPFHHRGRNWAYFRSMGSGWLEADFHNCYIWSWNMAIGQRSRSCAYTLFLPKRVELELIFTLWAAISKIRADFSKLPYLVMKLGHWPKFQRLHIKPLSTLDGRNWAYFALWAAVSKIQADFLNCHIWPWNLPLIPKVAHIIPFYPSWSKLILFSLYGQRFQRYGLIFKIATFGLETWPLPKVPEVAHILSFYPGDLNWAYFRYWPIFKIANVWGYETLPLAKVPEIVHILPKLLPSSNFHCFTLRL